jgi:hypothetical protein
MLPQVDRFSLLLTKMIKDPAALPWSWCMVSWRPSLLSVLFFRQGRQPVLYPSGRFRRRWLLPGWASRRTSWRRSFALRMKQGWHSATSVRSTERRGDRFFASFWLPGKDCNNS